MGLSPAKPARAPPQAGLLLFGHRLAPTPRLGFSAPLTFTGTPP
jgi:hypothetical protein